MCCESEGHHSDKQSHHHSHHGGSCCCGGHSGFGPYFWTKEEKIAWLERYREGLQEKVKAVEDRVAALKGEE